MGDEKIIKRRYYHGIMVEKKLFPNSFKKNVEKTKRDPEKFEKKLKGIIKNIKIDY